MTTFLVGVASSALALLLVAASVQAAPSSDPAPPAANASPEQIKAWIARNIDETGYVETATSGSTALLLADPASLRVLPNGHVVGVFRSELFSPMAKNGNMIRSARKSFEIDCGDLRHKELTTEEYAGSNLRRPIANPSAPADWSQPPDPKTAGGVSMRAVCALATAKHP